MGAQIYNQKRVSKGLFITPFAIVLHLFLPSMKNVLAGLLAAIGIAFTARWLAHFTPWMGSASWAIITGLLLGNVQVLRPYLESGSKWTEKNVLQWAVALLGLQVSFASIGQVGQLFIGLLLITALLLASARWLLPALGLQGEQRLFWLMGSGEAVCGSAAIASVSGSIGCKAESTGAAVLVINLFSTLGLIGIPLLLAPFEPDAQTAAWWTGGYLQSAGHAIAAGFALGEESGTLATTLKLSRVALLLPLVLLSRWLFTNRLDSSVERKKLGSVLPYFLWVFVALVLLSNLIELPKDVQLPLEKLNGYMLTTALAAIGMNIRLGSLRKSGGPALKAGLVLTFIHLLGMVILWRLLQ